MSIKLLFSAALWFFASCMQASETPKTIKTQDILETIVQSQPPFLSKHATTKSAWSTCCIYDYQKNRQDIFRMETLLQNYKATIYAWCEKQEFCVYTILHDGQHATIAHDSYTKYIHTPTALWCLTTIHKKALQAHRSAL